MCVKMITKNSTIPYNIEAPLESQLKGVQKIEIEYTPFDKSLEKFLDEVERFVKTGLNYKLNIVLKHNDNIFGINTKKKISKLTNDININELIKFMALSHAEVDKKLEELSNICLGNNCNVKQNA